MRQRLARAPDLSPKDLQHPCVPRSSIYGVQFIILIISRFRERDNNRFALGMRFHPYPRYCESRSSEQSGHLTLLLYKEQPRGNSTFVPLRIMYCRDYRVYALR